MRVLTLLCALWLPTLAFAHPQGPPSAPPDVELLRRVASDEPGARAELARRIAEDPACAVAAIEGCLSRADLAPTESARLQAALTSVVAEGVASCSAACGLGKLEGLSWGTACGIARGIVRRGADDGPTAPDQVLWKLAEDGEDRVVSEVFDALPKAVRRLDARWLDRLCRGLESEDAQVRTSAHDALCSITARELEPNPDRWKAWWRVSNQRTRELDRALASLTQGTRRERAEARAQLVRSLEADPRLIRDLSDALEWEDVDPEAYPAITASVATAFAETTRPGVYYERLEAEAPVCLALGVARGVHGRAVVHQADEDLLEALELLIEHEDPEVRAATIAALPACVAELDGVWAPRLLDALDDGDRRVCAAAWRALRRFSGTSLAQSSVQWRDWWRAGGTSSTQYSRGGVGGSSGGGSGLKYDAGFRWGASTPPQPVAVTPRPSEASDSTVALAALATTLLLLSGLGALVLSETRRRGGVVVDLEALRLEQEQRMQERFGPPEYTIPERKASPWTAKMHRLQGEGELIMSEAA